MVVNGFNELISASLFRVGSGEEHKKEEAAEMGLSVQVHEPLPKKPILVMTWPGLEPNLPSVLLNSHMDVVPVFEKKRLNTEDKTIRGEINCVGIHVLKDLDVLGDLEAVTCSAV
ncbi:hypothetical protein HF086_014690 [Spodoptera exigua]|uniref:Aminoacylase-1 n=1 Tax=Spodoptera exigua TaxID=7107 RepID=A0A922M848_SPOEX|nr:hypothetical protein HF086_014690 [Spodoptera exigua]